MDDDEGYYYTGQTPFRKPNESRLRFHARRLVSIQTLSRLEYTVEEAESKFNRALGPIELTFVGLGRLIPRCFLLAIVVRVDICSVVLFQLEHAWVCLLPFFSFSCVSKQRNNTANGILDPSDRSFFALD